MSTTSIVTPSSNNCEIAEEITGEIRKEYMPFCIFGTACGRRFCMTDLLAPNFDIKKCLLRSILVCNKCFRQLQLSYEIFAGRLGRLREDFFESYLAVKMAAMLNEIKSEIDVFGCACGRKDCKITLCGIRERDIIIRKFNSMYAAFVFSISPTDTRSDDHGWLGRGQTVKNQI